MNRRIVLFGAFDRHNLGDLLFPHLVAALLRERGLTDELLFAGLASRDMRSCGGHAVQALARLAANPDARPTAVIHVGGEVLTCDAWRAAVMLLAAGEVQATVAYFERHAAEKAAWVRRILGVDALAPYTLARSAWPAVDRVLYNAVGGVDLATCDPALQAEVIDKLKAADRVGVRDPHTAAQLAAAGVAARLLPDPAVMVAELFGTAIRERVRAGEVARVHRMFPHGYLAVQFSADCGDDRTLATIAGQLERVAHRTGLGLVFFRAGAAPWHDDLGCYARAAAQLRRGKAHLFESLHLWDICALIAQSRGFCGSSLHGRIVALAFALPRVNLRSPASLDHPGKQAAFATAWDDDPMPSLVDIDDLAAGLDRALDSDPAVRERRAAELVHAYRDGFDALCAGLT